MNAEALPYTKGVSDLFYFAFAIDIGSLLGSLLNGKTDPASLADAEYMPCIDGTIEVNFYITAYVYGVSKRRSEGNGERELIDDWMA
jgi:hypothetical protein